MRTGSRQPYNIVTQVVAEVVDAVLRVEYVSESSDKQMFGRLMEFAVWTHRRKRSFSATNDLHDQAIADYIAEKYVGYAESTRGSVSSVLRRILAGHGPKPTAHKRRSVNPYSDRHWQAFWHAAHQAGPHSLDAQILLTLTGELGLTPTEAHHATSDWIGKTERTRGRRHRPVLRVPDDNGEFRTIPLDSNSAQILKTAQDARPNQYLLMPSWFSGRKSVITKLVIRLEKSHRIFGSYYSHRARATWMTRLLAKPIPFHHIAYLTANKTSITPVTLTALMTPPTETEVYNSLRKAGLL